MKKVITYTEEQVIQIQYMLNAVTVTVIQNAKQVAAIAQMLELGTPGEISEPVEPVEKNVKGNYPIIWEELSEADARLGSEKKKEGAS
ncbi:hypothetical protein [Lacrimispora sp.]|uniref:hypothetical protein n=1 Tax=Lacrimispora sp. TaxID=2719234 RepID=UPI0028A5BCFE|nr:hypothetical protein [Lacrimispora sp.]